MATEAEAATLVHGGRFVARRLKAHGVGRLFTLSGGHLFSIYDGCRAEGIELIDTRHEQTAAFAAEGWAKVTRGIGVCALTAGPGVTNGISAIAAAGQNRSPLLVLGGRAPAFRWGQGSLQEIDHIPVVRPLVKLAATAMETEEIPGLIDDAVRAALAPRSGPAFLDFPLDRVFAAAEDRSLQQEAEDRPLLQEAGGPSRQQEAGDRSRQRGVEDAALPARSSWGPPGGSGAPAGAIERAAALLREAERPVVMAGTGLYWGFGERALRALVEQARIPVFLNGLGRGCLPADHELFFSRARAAALGRADVALVIGAELDFRLAFGGAFAADAEILMIDVAEPDRALPRPVAAELYGELPATLEGLRQAGGPPAGGSAGRERWLAALREIERDQRAAEAAELTDPRAPLHPVRVYGELLPVLDRDAVIVVDGGDFASFAGRLVETCEPGCWLDPGPFGCLGSGFGYALAAKLARPDRQVVLLLGDGAFGFSGMELDTLARHNVAVLAVVGNNGIWALEKHPMEALYGYSVAAELRAGTRYDLIAEALGCHGELVSRPEELRPALERALASGKPALVNVLTDPTVAYPRRAVLA